MKAKKQRQKAIHYLGTGIISKAGSEVCINVKGTGTVIAKICNVEEHSIVIKEQGTESYELAYSEIQTINGVPATELCIEVIEI